jgi:large repetitive protein
VRTTKHRSSMGRVKAACIGVAVSLIGMSTYVTASAVSLPSAPVTQTYAAGAYIVDMGQPVQTVANGLKPYGLVYDLVVNKKIPVIWAFSDTKPKDGVDFTVGAKSYTGSAFIVPAPFATEALSTINSWKAKGVVVDGPTTSSFAAPAFQKITSFPKSVLDLAKGSLAVPYYTKAEIPPASYRLGTPASLTTCDDLYVMPHADPAWATHNNLIAFNQRGGFVWAGCHSVSVLENIDDPADAGTAPNMNFLSTNGLIDFGSHSAGTAPYTYDFPGNPVSQFKGIADAAQANGSERIYFPSKPSDWRSTTKVVAYDPTPVAADAANAGGKGATIVSGPGFGNPSNGQVMYEAGHSLDGTAPDNVAAIRSFFDFQILAGIAAALDVTATIPTNIDSGATVPVSTTATGGSNAYTYQWASSCGGTFASATAASTTFTAPTTVASTPCNLKVIVTDGCGRVSFDFGSAVISPPQAADIEVTATVDKGNPVVGETVTYSIGARNDVGPGNADGVKVVDVLPAGLTLVSATPTRGSYSAGSWTIGPLTFGTSANLEIKAKVKAGTEGLTITNTATISSTSADPVSTNNSRSAALTVNRLPVAAPDSRATPESTPLTIPLFANDSIGDGPITVTANTNPGHGSVSINPSTGQALYSPTPGFHGVDMFTYTVTDANGDVSTTTVTITVTNVDDPPVAADDAKSTAEDTPVNINVLTNDSDLDGNLDAASVRIVGAPTNGSVVVNLDGTVKYMPNPDYFGLDTFTYEICDSTVPPLCDTATVRITVTSVNDPVKPSDDAAATPEDTPIKIAVLDNDSDAEGLNRASLTIDVPPSHGGVVVNADGTITYTPAPNYNGTDTFTYQICDNSTPASCRSAVVVITIAPVEDAPVAVNDSAITPEDTAIALNLPANDEPGDRPLDPTSVSITSAPTNGRVVVDAAGKATYTPNPNFHGTDTFRYQICDSGSPVLCAMALATVTVTPVNDLVVAADDRAITNEDVPIIVGVLGNDADPDFNIDPATISVTVLPSHGTVTGNPDGTIKYTPSLNFDGTDTFTYQICDTGSPVYCDTAVVAITVKAVNDPPAAGNDLKTTPEDTPVVVNLVSNDADVEGPLNLASLNAIAGPFHGSVVVHADGTTTYSPDPNFSGTDTFTYQICDTGSPLPSLCTTAMVTITVTPVNDPPVAQPETVGTPESTEVTVSVLRNDADVDGNIDPGSVTITGPPSAGVASVNPDGTIRYTPVAGFSGAVTLTYKVCDRGTPPLCDLALVTVVVAPVNDPPAASNDIASTNEDVAVLISVAANDSDPDPNLDPLSVTVVASPFHGATNVDPTGRVRYVPAADFHGTDTFQYKICDTGLPIYCDIATVSVTILPVNDPPNLMPDAASTPEDVPVTIGVLNNDGDIDPNLNPSSLSIVAGPGHGAVAVNPDGTTVYTPTPNYNGLDSFSYEVCDAGLPVYCRTTTASVTVSAVNDTPKAVNDLETTPEDTPVTLGLLINDSDGDGSLDPATTTTLTLPTHGTVVVDSVTGAAAYAPNRDFHGIDTFTYQVCDNGAPVLCDQAVATITVTPVNDPPAPVADTASTPEDTTVTLPLLANDGDPDLNLDPTSLSISVDPQHGIVSVDLATGIASYTPNRDFHGTDMFTYKVCDTGAPVFCETVVGTVLVASVPDAPVAVDDSRTTSEDTSIKVGVLVNDLSVEGPLDPASVRVTSAPSNGTVSVNATTGEVTYAPNLNWSGINTFTYEVCGSMSPRMCDAAVVTITVTSVNDAPTLSDDAGSTQEDTPISVSVLVNDSDVEGQLDPSSLGVTVNPTHGIVAVQANGRILYTPALNYSGPDTFTYKVCDLASPAACATALVRIDVTPLPDAPAAVVDSAVTDEGTPVDIDVLINDTDPESNIDPTSVSLTAPPSSGTVAIDPLTGKITYAPSPNFNGTDRFTYQVCDMGVPVQCDTAVVTVVVRPVNDPPVAADESVTTSEDRPIVVSMLTNDTDIDANLDRTSVTITVNPTRGSATVNADGTITYAPDLNYSGTDSITYKVCDTGTPVYCDTAVITIGITPVNDAPSAFDDDRTTPEETPIAISVFGNDTDVDGVVDPTSVSVTAPPTSGTTSVDPLTGVVMYTPNLNFVGVDHFPYEICDLGLPVLCSSALVTITVTPVNDAPAPNDDTVITPEDTPVNVSVITNDTDPDANLDLAAVTVTGLPTHGTATANADGTVTYTPNSNFAGADLFVYSICDTGLPVLCAPAQVDVTISAINDAPVAVDDVRSTPEGTPISVLVVGNDSDVDGTIDPTTVTVTNPASNGTTLINAATGTVLYTPNPDFVGIDTFTYQVCDNGAPVLCAAALATIDVAGINDLPVANDDSLAASAETPVIVPVLQNDSDIDGNLDPHSVTIETNPGHGTVRVNADGTMMYSPETGYIGADSFTYRVCDTGMPVYCDSAIVTIAVSTTNLPPTAVVDRLSVKGGVVSVVAILENDTDPNNNLDPGSVTIVGDPANGVATANSDGTITYRADTNYVGSDLVTDRVCDTGKPRYCAVSLLEVTVTETATPPEAKPDFAVTSPAAPVTLDLLANDFAPEVPLNPASVSVSAPPNNGSVSIAPAAGSATYSPNPGFAGVDTFTYGVCDTATKTPRCTRAVATVTVTRLNVPPIAEPDFASTPQATPVAMNLIGNDRDPDGALVASSLLILAQPKEGAVAITTNGEVVYAPNVGFTGISTFTYQICDNGPSSMCAVSTGTVTVTPVDSPMVVRPDFGATVEGVPVTISVLANDRDPDGQLDVSSVLVVTNPPNGTVATHPDGTVTYTPKPTFTGVDTFIYRVCNTDTPSQCSESTVTVTVGLLHPERIPKGSQETSGFGGRLFVDDDGDGKQSADERGFEGQTVTLIGAGLDGEFGTADDTRITAVTNSKGDFVFEGLIPGKYKLVTSKDSGGLRIDGDHELLLDLKPGQHDRLVAVLPYSVVAAPSQLAFTGVNATRNLVLLGLALISGGVFLGVGFRRRRRSWHS